MAAPRPDQTRRPAAGVAPGRAEELRQRLMASGLLERDLQPRRDREQVWFPLNVDADADAVHAALAGIPGAEQAECWFDGRTRRAGHYSDLLPDLAPDLRALLPTGYDVVGQVVVLKLPEPLLAVRERIGAALLSVHRNARTVALDRGVTGPLRVRDLEVIAGGPTLETVHREHGLELQVALDRVYFSPRLATERARLAARVAPGARVLDLFAGVGAFVCLVARDRAPSALTAIDLNPHATRLLQANLERNRIDTPVDVRQGDARAVAPRSADWDHVVMNLPHDASAFLDVAVDCVAPTGEVHLYAMVERDTHDLFVDDLEQEMTERMDAPWAVVAERHVRNYAPTMDGLGFTLRRTDPSA